MSFAYDAAGNLTDHTDVAGATWHFTYDADHHLLSMRRPNQAGEADPKVVTNVYDGNGRVVSQTDEVDRTTLIDYISVPSSTKITDPRGNVVVEGYENYARTSITRGFGTPDEATWRLSYDETFGISRVRDPNDHLSYADYDSHGNMTAYTDALGHSTLATYNSFDDPLTMADANGVTTSFDYDANGNLTSLSTPLAGAGVAQITVFGYDPAHPGDLVAVTDPRGEV